MKTIMEDITPQKQDIYNKNSKEEDNPSLQNFISLKGKQNDLKYKMKQSILLTSFVLGWFFIILIGLSIYILYVLAGDYLTLVFFAVLINIS